MAAKGILALLFPCASFPVLLSEDDLSMPSSFIGISWYIIKKHIGSGEGNSEGSLRRDVEKYARQQATVVSKGSECRKQAGILIYC